MRALSDSDGLLVIQGPTWLGVLLIALAIVVAITVVALARKVPRPWRLGGFLGTIVLLCAGWHLIGTRTTLESRGFYVESIYGEEQRVGWLEVSIDLSGLAPEERARVVAYVRKHLSRVKENR